MNSPARKKRCVELFPRRVWSRRDKAILAELYANTSTAKIATKLRRGISGIYGMAGKMGLAKTDEYLSRYCRLQKGSVVPGSEQHRFAKGHVPANKGLRRPGWSPGRMKETQFKKGARTGAAAKNWRPIGTIRADHEGYLRIKVREAVHGKEATGFGNTNVWPLLNRHIWEQHHGPIPPKHIVAFKDGNRANCDIGNLELISKADNARRNSMWHRYPPELSSAIMLAGALKRRIRRLSGKEQNRRSA